MNLNQELIGKVSERELLKVVDPYIHTHSLEIFQGRRKKKT